MSISRPVTIKQIRSLYVISGPTGWKNNIVYSNVKLTLFLIDSTKSLLYHFTSKLCKTSDNIWTCATYSFCNVTKEKRNKYLNIYNTLFEIFQIIIPHSLFFSLFIIVIGGNFKCFVIKRSLNLYPSSWPNEILRYHMFR